MLRRSREQILVGILKSCATKGALVSHLLSSENLSYRLLRSYLDRLLASELICLDSGGQRTTIMTTERGLEVLRCYGNGVALLNGHVATCPLFHPHAEQTRPILA
jgi:predicted transcriptional regulator